MELQKFLDNGLDDKAQVFHIKLHQKPYYRINTINFLRANICSKIFLKTNPITMQNTNDTCQSDKITTS